MIRQLSAAPRGLRFVPLAGFVLSAILLASCAAREGDQIGSPIFNGTTPDGQTVEAPRTTLPSPEVDAIRVPLDSFSIQGAVDQAQPGDLILVDPGVYTEEVVISTPDIVIRGRDRNTVFVDGIHGLTNGLVVQADGVAIENLTVRNYLGDGISVGTLEATQVNRFRALHVTTSNTAMNGIALRNVTNAEVRQGWHSGHGVAGVLITGCTQCSTLITATLVEYSAKGFNLVGAMDGVSVFSSTSRNNRVGIVVEDGPLQPTTGAVIAGNVVLNNGFTSTPNDDPLVDRGFGVGIQVGGTVSASIMANQISGNTRAGIVLAPSNANRTGDPIAPQVERNEVSGHPEFDIVLAFEDEIADPSTCIVDNGQATIGPAGAAEAAACGDTNTTPPAFVWTGEPRQSIDYVNGPVPPGIDGMLDADSAPAIPAGPVGLPDPSTATPPAG